MQFASWLSASTTRRRPDAICKRRYALRRLSLVLAVTGRLIPGASGIGMSADAELGRTKIDQRVLPVRRARLQNSHSVSRGFRKVDCGNFADLGVCVCVCARLRESLMAGVFVWALFWTSDCRRGF